MKTRVTYNTFILIAFCISVIIFSCNKNDDEITTPPEPSILEGIFLFDSVTYYGSGADLFYKLDIHGGTPPYSISWEAPTENDGIGPFHKNLHYHYTFKAIVLDSKEQQCTIEYAFNYLDKVTGTYKCNFHIWEYGPYATYDTSGIADFIVSESYGDQIKFLSTIFRLDSAWSFSGFHYQGWHIFDFDFFPKHDSINVYIMDGGLGAGMKHIYKGVKPSN